MVGFGHCESKEMEFPEVVKIIEAGKRSFLQRILECSILISGAQVGAISLSREQLTMSRGNFGCSKLENANGVQQVELKNAAKQPTMDRKPHNREFSSPRC